jgi:hypothetical protein
MYKGSTPAAPGLHSSPKLEHPLSFLGASLVHSAKAALARLGMLGKAGMRA